nr:histone-lysine N-methyltransferase family member SUVH9-like [Ipomoea batatas]
MASLVPFQDLDLQLGPSTFTGAGNCSSSGAGSSGMIVPKIEPKLEPLDEFAQADLQTPASFSNPSPTSNSGFSLAPPRQSEGGYGLSFPGDDNVYSEFHRISEMFRTAFAKRMQRYGDVEVVEDPDSRAIVPVNNEGQLSTVVIARRKYQQRSSELVRVTDLSPEDQRYFRDVVRRTRMLYDSIRVLAPLEDERNQQFGHFKKTRGDLKAAQLMRERGLWLNRDKRIVGSIPGVYVGDLFFFRMELCVVGLHGQVQAGIDFVSASHSSNGEPIATSVIVSGGYEDDMDSGDVIIYTGHGGQDKNSRQCVSQKLEGGNLALERSMYYGVEVRVIRGFKYEGSASGKVYVYDGLYRIVDCWADVGKSGFGVFKYKLVRIEDQPEMGSAVLKFAETLRTRPLEARPTGYVSLDISRKKENVPVFLYNDIDTDQEPAYYDYLAKTIFPPHVFQYMGASAGCDCVNGCFGNCFCAIRNGGEFAYDHNGILLRGKPLVLECGPHCRCPATCRNRVSQKGVRKRFEVFRSRETGWGVRSLDLIQAGSFICEYAGIVLTKEQEEIFKMNGDSLIYPSRFSERWAEWGDLSQIYPEYVRPSYPSIPPLDFAMDVSRMRNLACYMSHSSSPNVLVQLVLYDHNYACFPRLMLFAMENIPPLQELSIDYGVADDLGKLAICN